MSELLVLRLLGLGTHYIWLVTEKEALKMAATVISSFRDTGHGGGTSKLGKRGEIKAGWVSGKARTRHEQ